MQVEGGVPTRRQPLTELLEGPSLVEQGCEDGDLIQIEGQVGETLGSECVTGAGGTRESWGYARYMLPTLESIGLIYAPCPPTCSLIPMPSVAPCGRISPASRPLHRSLRRCQWGAKRAALPKQLPPPPLPLRQPWQHRQCAAPQLPGRPL